jgi:hypothetical protein
MPEFYPVSRVVAPGSRQLQAGGSLPRRGRKFMSADLVHFMSVENHMGTSGRGHGTKSGRIKKAPGNGTSKIAAIIVTFQSDLAA